MTIKPLVPPSDFVGLDDVTHLCTGGESPWLRVHDDVYTTFARDKGGGAAGRDRIAERNEACRAKLGQLWGVPPQRIAFAPSASEGMSAFARGLEWREGDNVVTDGIEFPSVCHPWSRLPGPDVEVRWVEPRGWRVHEDDLIAAMDARTRVLSISQVSFYTGQRLNLERLCDAAKDRGALLAVDATHASGVVDVPAELTDLCLSSAYKWMLATHGVAPCYVSEQAEAQTRPTAFGWRNLDGWPPREIDRQGEDAIAPMPQRLEPGNPAMVAIEFLNRALDLLLDLGVARIEAHALELAELVADGLQRLPFEVITPRERGARSGNTCIAVEDGDALTSALARHGVLVWGNRGRVRVSTHLYNGSEDVERLLAVLATM